MRAYLIVFEAHPTRAAVPTKDLAGAIVHLWVMAKSVKEAERRGRGYVSDHHWVIDAVAHRLQPSRAQVARLGDEELQNYTSALRYGISAHFIAWLREGAVAGTPASRSALFPVIREVSAERARRSEEAFWEWESERRRRFSVKCCLHPNAGPQGCAGPIVKAHSVQRNGSLSRIANHGHIYRITAEGKTLRRTAGMPAAKLVGLKHASTFTGLCARHDDMTFAPVEKRPFRGDREQCFLLAYRAALRETYVKRAALETRPAVTPLINAKPRANRPALRRLAHAFFEGTKRGLRALEKHKNLLDRMLVLRDFEDIRFVLIEFRKVPDVMVSAIWCPTSDFDGYLLPNVALLGHRSAIPDALTFSVIGTPTGGVAAFVWHKRSDAACNRFVASLVVQERRTLSDAIVRLAFQMSENIYLRPDWWEGLAEAERAALSSRMAGGLDPLVPFRGTDLVDDGLRLASWEASFVTLRVTSEGGVLETKEWIAGRANRGLQAARLRRAPEPLARWAANKRGV